MSKDRKVGFQAAVERVGIEIPSVREQPDMFAAPDPVEPRRAGTGRPPGSQNKATGQIAEWLARRYRSPLEGASEIAQLDLSQAVALLRQELGCDGLEAAKLWLEAIKTVLPYRHQKLPQALEIETDEEIGVVIIGKIVVEQRQDDGSGAVVIDGEMIDEETFLNQALSEADK